MSTTTCPFTSIPSGRNNAKTINIWRAQMDLFEYQGKQFFAKYGMPTSPGKIVSLSTKQYKQLKNLEHQSWSKHKYIPAVEVKLEESNLPQLLRTLPNTLQIFLDLISRAHCRKGLDRESFRHSEEYYASFTLDRSAKKHLGMLSKEGGVEIETVAEENPDAIAKIWVDP